MKYNILIVEDNHHKRTNIIDFIRSTYPNLSIDVCHSFTSAWTAILSNEYELIFLDMSLPTFDQTESGTGGAFRTFGGKELARKIKRRKIGSHFLFITQYKNFSEDNSIYSFESIKMEITRDHPQQCKGFILYSNSSSDWKEDILKAIRETINENNDCR